MDINEILTSRTFETDWDKNNFTRWIKSIADILKDADINAVLSNKESLCKLFYNRLENTSVNRQKYQQVKKDIQVLQNYYGIKIEIPTREEVLESQEVTSLYKDLLSLLDFIDQVGSIKLKNYNKDQDLIIVKAIVILGWRGINKDCIVSIEKKDIQCKDNNFFIATNEGNFAITREDYDVLIKLSALTEYHSLPNGRPVVIKSNNNYLFPIAKSTESGDTMPTNSIPKILKKFSEATQDMGKAIIYRYLRKNALFSELYDEWKNADQQANLTEIIQKKFNCEAKAALGYKTEYKLWAVKYSKS